MPSVTCVYIHIHFHMLYGGKQRVNCGRADGMAVAVRWRRILSIDDEYDGTTHDTQECSEPRKPENVRRGMSRSTLFARVVLC